MNKAQFIEKIAKKTKLPKNQIELILDEAINTIKTAIKQNDEVKLVGFGTFDRIKKKARAGRNPMSGEKISIPATFCPRFRPGKHFKDLLNNKVNKR